MNSNIQVNNQVLTKPKNNVNWIDSSFETVPILIVYSLLNITYNFEKYNSD